MSSLTKWNLVDPKMHFIQIRGLTPYEKHAAIIQANFPSRRTIPKVISKRAKLSNVKVYRAHISNIQTL